MEKKVSSLKKSTMQQLQTLVECMEEHPNLARSTPVFGANKFFVEEQWKDICDKVKALGPPKRSIAEWKKTWADLKCRTKKKISENSRSLLETGGGIYRYNPLTALEQIIDRTLLLSSGAAPDGKVYGDGVESVTSQSVEKCFRLLVESPPRADKAVAVITPHRKTKDTTEESADRLQILQEKIHPNIPPKRDFSHPTGGDDDKPTCSSSKKRKSAVDEQLSLIRRQLRVSESQADAIKRLASAAEVQAESAKRKANATEVQSAWMKTIMESMQRLDKNVETLVLSFKK